MTTNNDQVMDNHFDALSAFDDADQESVLEAARKESPKERRLPTRENISARSREAVIAYKGKKIDLNALARECLPEIQRICKSISKMSRFPRVNDQDLAQEVWLVFEKRFADNFDESYPFAPLIWEIARRIAMKMNGAHGREMCETDMTNGDESEEDSVLHQETSEIDFDQLDRKSKHDRLTAVLKASSGLANPFASEEIVDFYKNDPDSERTMLKDNALVKDVPSTKEPATLPVIKGIGRKTTETRLCREQKELVGIRKKLGMTQTEFAEQLNIGLPRLSSYEYGKVDSVDVEVMERARALLETSTKRDDWYSRLKMSEILARWVKQLNIPIDDTRLLQAELNVSTASLSRWRNDKTRPSNAIVEQINTHVLRRVAERNAEARAKKKPGKKQVSAA